MIKFNTIERNPTQQDILTISANSANKISDYFSLDGPEWEKIYNKLIEVLNEILDNPEFIDESTTNN